ncbi:unnamed protein product [Mytilus edulis]|uniref:Cysteine and tyrosine-rich protein 1 n=1 Tax=Mytilus edulis TaxID=6550 RepID=A0A8S3UX50_MYTED|nr:unnamed protein product [Mytilus edulis]
MNEKGKCVNKKTTLPQSRKTTQGQGDNSVNGGRLQITSSSNENLTQYLSSNGAIAGILVGILAAVAIFIIAVVICVKTVNKRRGGMSQGSVVTPVGTSNVAVFTTPPVNPNIQTAFHCGYPVQCHPPPNMGYPMQPIEPESQTSFPPNMGYSMHPIEPLPPPYRKPDYSKTHGEARLLGTGSRFITGAVVCDQCYHYAYGYSYCSGYCSGYYGSEYCIYYTGYYIFSGGAIAGLVFGIIAAAAIFIVVVIMCIKNHNKRTIGRVVGPAPNTTTVAVTSTTHPTGYMQPMNPYPSYTTQLAMQPQSTKSMYPRRQLIYSISQDTGAPTQPQYNSIYNQPHQHLGTERRQQMYNFDSAYNPPLIVIHS